MKPKHQGARFFDGTKCWKNGWQHSPNCWSKNKSIFHCYSWSPMGSLFYRKFSASWQYGNVIPISWAKGIAKL